MQPPGIAIFTRPNFASRGPATRIEALIFLTSSYGASRHFILEGSISTIFFCLLTLTLAPSILRTSTIVITSSIMGTLVSVVLVSASIDAARSFSAEFFAPSTVTLPESVFPPFMINLAIKNTLIY